jgi:hypothetical protein
MNKSKTISVAEAARLLGVGEPGIRAAIQALRIKNNTDSLLQNLHVTINTEPLFSAPWETQISVIAPGEFYNLGAVDLSLSPDFLFQLNERVLGTVNITVSTEDNRESKKSEKIAVLVGHLQR